jgi:DNA-binding transcriptional LysR family regulator
LEALLGHSIFDRRAIGYALRAEGKTLIKYANVMDEAALSILRRLDAGTELSGRVHLAAGRVLAERFLIDRLRAFHERYPAIDLEVIGGSRVVSLAKREADIALRYGSPKDSELVARRVARLTFGLYTSLAYHDKLKAGQSPAFIGFDENSEFIAEAKWLKQRFGDHRFSFRTSSQLPCFQNMSLKLMNRDLWKSRPERTYLSVMCGSSFRRDLTKVPRVRVVADYLVELFQRERRLLSS